MDGLQLNVPLDITPHEAAADPHTGYQKESEKDAANGYAGLTAGGKIKTDVVENASITNSAVTSLKLNDGAVTFLKIQNMSASSIIGRNSSGVGAPSQVGLVAPLEYQPAADLIRIATAGILKSHMENAAADTLLGRGNGGGAGVPQAITLGTNLSMTGTVLNASGGGGAHVIEDEGTPVTQQTNMNFVGAGVTVTDTGGKTQVSIPGGAGSDPFIGSYAPGSFTIATEKYAVMSRRLILTTTQIVTIEGTGCLRIT